MVLFAESEQPLSNPELVNFMVIDYPEKVSKLKVFMALPLQTILHNLHFSTGRLLTFGKRMNFL